MVATLQRFIWISFGMVIGAAITGAGVFAATSSPLVGPSVDPHRQYMVSIDEVKQNLVSGDIVSGSYHRQVRLTDGSLRDVTLRPVLRNGVPLVELTDVSPRTGKLDHSFMGPNATATDGKLMINVKDVAQARQQMREAAANR